MTDKIQSLTIILMTTIMLTGGIVPYSFADDDEDEYVETQADRRCETPSKLHMLYNGPDNAHVEIYKKPGQAKNKPNKMIYEFPQYFNNGDTIELDSKAHMDRDQLKTKTTYKIIHGNDYVIIPVDTSCETPMKKGGTYEKDGITLTMMYGGDTDGDDVIYDEYYSKKHRKDPKCEAPNIELNFEDVLLQHGAQASAIDAYLDGKGLGNIDISAMDGDHNAPIIFNTDEYGTSDPDLEVDEGNIVIRAENLIDNNPADGFIDDPDDATSSGTVTFDFDIPLTVHSYRWIDLDHNEDATAIAFGFDEATQSYFEIDREDVDDDGRNTGNGEATFVPFDAPVDNVARLVFDYSSSGGFTDICVQSPPEPTGEIKITKVTTINSVPTEIPGTVFDFNGVPIIGPFILDTDESDDTHLSTESFIVPVGDYIVTETEPSGFTLQNIVCDDPTVDTSVNVEMREASIELGEEIVHCTFYNEQIPPTGSITFKKAITNDNGGNAVPEDFMVTLTESGNNQEIGSFVTIDPADPTMGILEFINIPAGTYVLNEDLNDPDDSVFPTYNTVLVAGDTECPSMENEEFTLNEGDHFTCTIYNDDDFLPGDGEINTMSNVGDFDIFKQKVGVDFELRGLKAGDGITMVQYGNNILLNATVPTGVPPTVEIEVRIVDPNFPFSATDFTYAINGVALQMGGPTSTPIPADTQVVFEQTNYIGEDADHPLTIPTSIQGDGNCPEVIGPGSIEVPKEGTIALSANHAIKCIIVYGEPAPIFFHRNSFPIFLEAGGVISNNPTSNGCPGVDERNACLNSSIDGGFNFVLSDPAITSDTSTILLNITPKTATGFADCVANAFIPNGPQFDVNISCLTFNVFVNEPYNVNYVIFESDVPL